MTDHDPMVQVQGVSKYFDGACALDDVSFELRPSEVFALVGPNGAGKTTLLRLLTGILTPDAGHVMVAGSSHPLDVARLVGYMPEERGLYRSQGALETITYFACLKGLPTAQARQAAERALDAVGVLAHGKRKVEELSKGMSQRVQFAATIVHKPRILILDEPFSGLDPVSARELMTLIIEQRDRGVSILLSTHNMDHAEKLSDRLLMLHRGRVQLYGGLSEVRSRYTDSSVVVKYVGELPAIEGISTELIDDHTAKLSAESETARSTVLTRLVSAGAQIERYEPVEPTLEDIFVRIVGAEGQEALRQQTKLH